MTMICRAPLVVCLIWVTLCLLTACARRNICVLYGRPPTFKGEDFADDWIGFTHSDNAYYRLNLTTNNDGVLMGVFATNHVVNYNVTSWIVLSNNMVICQFQPAKNQFDPTNMTCEFQFEKLDSTLYGYDGWREKIQFRRTKFLEDNLSKLGLQILNSNSLPH